jgi:hypothetical protein
MPILNYKGDILAGGGGSQGSVNKKPFPFATFGGGTWLNDNLVLLQVPRPDPQKGELGVWFPGNPEPAQFFGVAANDFAANGNAYVAWHPSRGVFGDLTLRLTGQLLSELSIAGTCGVRAVGPNGSIAYIPNRQVGTGLRLVDPDGTVTDIPNIEPYDVQVLGKQQVIWKHGAYGRPVPKPACPDAMGVILVPASDGDWLVYWSETTGFIAQLDGAADGYILGTTPTFYNHDAKLVNNEVMIAWSITNGEAPTDVFFSPLNRSLPRVPLVPNIQPVDIKPLPRKTWISPFFSHSDKYGDTPLSEFTGNAITVTTDAADPNPELNRIRNLGYPMIIGLGNPNVDPINLNQTIAWWVSGATLDELHKNVNVAMTMPEKPIIAYLDNLGWPLSKPDWITNRVWPSIQAYRLPNEDLHQFEIRMDSAILTVSNYGNPMFLTPRFDDFNGQGSIAQTMEVMPLYDTWLRHFLIVGFMPFSDRRGNGIARNPILHTQAKAFLDANPARPNRYDYWIPSSGVATALRNKLAQTTETIVLLPEEKKYILNLLPK